uniref:Zinc finger C3HC4 RING-type domain-containing protein n=1 Tax=Panagrolaimus sp. JU765 TaxID=591449 RepID=A0AC34RFV7_9BILA
MSDCASVTAESPVKVDVPMPSVEDDYVEPKALVCFHSFCKNCIDNNIANGMITCPKCNVTMELGVVGAGGLLTDYGLVGLLASKSKADSIDACQGCMKSKDLSGKCNQCGFICNNCQSDHSHMLMFRDHVIEQYENNSSSVDVMHCMNHDLTAHIGHSIFLAKDIYSQHVQRVQTMLIQTKEKVSRMMEESEKLNDVYGQLQSCYKSAYSNTDNIADLIIKETNEFKSNAQSLLDAIYERWRKDAQLICQEYKKFAEKGVSMNDFAERLLEHSDMLGFLFFSELLNTKMTSFMQFDESTISSMVHREFFHDIINIKEDDVFSKMSDIQADDAVQKVEEELSDAAQKLDQMNFIIQKSNYEIDTWKGMVKELNEKITEKENIVFDMNNQVESSKKCILKLQSKKNRVLRLVQLCSSLYADIFKEAVQLKPVTDLEDLVPLFLIGKEAKNGVF